MVLPEIGTGKTKGEKSNVVLFPISKNAREKWADRQNNNKQDISKKIKIAICTVRRKKQILVLV